MKNAILIALLAAATLGVPTSAAAGETEARLALQSAQELYASGNWETATEAYEDALKQAGPKSITGAQASLELASLLWEQGEYAPAEKQVRDAMKRAKALKLDHAVGRLMLTLGHIEASRGQFGAAESTLNACVDSANEQNDQVFAALCRINLRFVRQVQGKSTPSETVYRADLEKLQKTGRALLVGTALAKSAELQERARDFRGALATLQAAEKQFAISDSLPAQARHRLRLAQAYQNLGQWGKAERELDGLVLLLRNMKNRPALVTAYALNGRQASNAGNGARALADMDRALSMAKEVGSPTLIANVQLGLCEHQANAGNMAQAFAACDDASNRFRKMGAPALASRAQILGARVAQANKSWVAARDRYRAAIKTLSEDVASSSVDSRELAVQRVNLCQVEVQLESNGAYLVCRNALQDVEEISYQDLSYRQMHAATVYNVAVTMPKEKRDEARTMLEQAAREWTSLGRRGQAAEAYLRLGKMQADSKDQVDAARATFERGIAMITVPDALTVPLLVQLRIQLVQRQLAENDYYGAKMTLPKLIADAEESDDAYSQAWAYNALASAELKTDERDKAIAALEKGLIKARRAGDAELEGSIERNLSKLKKKQ